MFQSLGAKTFILPTPVFLVGTYDHTGRPNIMTAAWGGICASQPPSIAVSIRKSRWTYNAILERKSFTINIPSRKLAAQSDFAGMHSGRDTDFANCATPMESVHIRGMEGNPEFWETIIEGKRHDFDMERLEAEIVGSAAAFAREKALDALVLECTDLSAFSAPIQRAINLPVYDINSLVEYAYYAVCRKDY